MTFTHEQHEPETGIGRLGAEAVEDELRMAAQDEKAHRQHCDSQCTSIGGREVTLGRGKHDRDPGNRDEDVQMLEMAEREAAKGERDRGQQRGCARLPQDAGEPERPDRCQQDVEGGGEVVDPAPEEHGEQRVGRIEGLRADVHRVRRTQGQKWIPEREVAGPEPLSRVGQAQRVVGHVAEEQDAAQRQRRREEQRDEASEEHHGQAVRLRARSHSRYPADPAAGRTEGWVAVPPGTGRSHRKSTSVISRISPSCSTYQV